MQYAGKLSILTNVLQEEVSSFTVCYKFLEMISFQGIKVLNFKITICQDILDDKIMMFTMVCEAVFFPRSKNIK